MPTSSSKVIKQPSESILYTFDFTPLLATDETISAISSFTEETTSDLTIASTSVLAAAVEVDGVTIAIGKGVQGRISGGTDGWDYRIEVVVTTSDSNTREMDGILQVRDH